MSSSDTAYQMWGVAQPCAPRTGGVKWPKTDVFSANILTVPLLESKIRIYEQSLREFPENTWMYEFCTHWLNYYLGVLSAKTVVI